MDAHNRLAILCGGGPAPGLNSVIAAATIRARLEGVDVVGLRDGFEWIMQGDIDHITPLTIEGVSRIHFRGGSHIGIARANPSKSPALLENAFRHTSIPLASRRRGTTGWRSSRI
jgi:ATP-dependent phosphofructokinase / diphosphate-dependent phosphofructokinase